AFGYFPRSESNDVGSVSGWLVGGSIVPCARSGVLIGCVVGSLGSLQGSGSGVTYVRGDASLYAAAGARIGAEFRMTDQLTLMPSAEFLGNVVRPRLQLNHADVWRAPSFSASGAVVATVYFR